MKNQNIETLHQGFFFKKEVIDADLIFTPLYMSTSVFALFTINCGGEVKITIDSEVKLIESNKTISILLMKGSNLKIESKEKMQICSFYFKIFDFFTFKNKIDKQNLKINSYELYSFNNIFTCSNKYYTAICMVSKSIMELAELDNQNYNFDIQYLLWDLIHLFENDMFYIGFAKPSSIKKDTDMAKVLNYIEDNLLTTKISISDLCKVASISKATLIRKFKKDLNCSPYSFVLKKKLTLAKRMIETSTQSISEIVFNLGFQNLVTFDRAFKKEFNCSPISIKKGKND